MKRNENVNVLIAYGRCKLRNPLYSCYITIACDISRDHKAHVEVFDVLLVMAKRHGDGQCVLDNFFAVVPKKSKGEFLISLQLHFST